MSITTKRGDEGLTDLLYGRRVPKDDPRVVTCGCVDELTSCLGLARAASMAGGGGLAEPLDLVQRTLILLMGQISVHPDDRERYRRDGFRLIDPSDVQALTARCEALEKALPCRYDDWVLPGAAGVSSAAFLDMARTLARRAERQVIALQKISDAGDHAAIAYLNRLSDYLWLLARSEENREGV